MISITEISNIQFDIFLLIAILIVLHRAIIIVDKSIDVYNKIDVILLKKIMYR